MNTDGIKVKSLAKALAVLDCFQMQFDLGVTEISNEVGLYKSNVSDILSTLRTMGYVTQDHQTGRYRLGYRILDLSHAMTKGMGFRQTVYPHMKQLADEFVETVYYGVPDNGDVVYLDAAYPGHEYATRAMLGDRAKLYCTGIGKAILSWMSAAERDAVLHFPLTAFTTQTFIDREALYCELDLARQRGYAVDNMEHEHGVKCVGAAVLNQRKQPVAAISLSGPSPRFDEERVAQIGARLVETVERMRLYF